MGNDVLKTLALRAKNRLLHNDAKADFEDARIKIIKSSDDDFYNKVMALLDRDEDVVNPLKELMDERLMVGMSVDQREKYLFQTIEKYQKLRSAWQDEKQLKLVY